MVNRFDTPLTRETNIEAPIIPLDEVKSGLSSKQDFYDGLIASGDELANQILSIESRDTVDEDSEYLKGLYNTFSNQRDAFLGQLDGDFSSADHAKLTQISQDILVPEKEKD
jgi:hypothetical protein